MNFWTKNEDFQQLPFLTETCLVQTSFCFHKRTMARTTIALICWLHFVSSLDTLALLETKNNLEIVDLQSDYEREVYGYIKNSILLSESDLVQADGSNMVVYVPESSTDDRFQSLNLEGFTKVTGSLKHYVQAGGQVEFPKTISFKVSFQCSRCLKITEKVSFNIASEASYVYI